MFRVTNSPILRSTFWLYIQLLVEMERQFHLNRGTGGQQCRCFVPKAVYTDKNCSWGWNNLSPETCRADLKRLINEKVVASCWLFTAPKIHCPLQKTTRPYLESVDSNHALSSSLFITNFNITIHLHLGTKTISLHFCLCWCLNSPCEITTRLNPGFNHLTIWNEECKSWSSSLYRFHNRTTTITGARGGAVGWGTALQVGRSRVRFPMVSLEFFIDIILPAALWSWGWLSL